MADTVRSRHAAGQRARAVRRLHEVVMERRHLRDQQAPAKTTRKRRLKSVDSRGR